MLMQTLSTRASTVPKSVKRKRVAQACDQCRRRKSRCDGGLDCSACKLVGLQCSYGDTTKQARGPSYVAHLEKRIQELEVQVARLATTSESGGCNLTFQSPGSGSKGAERSPVDWAEQEDQLTEASLTVAPWILNDLEFHLQDDAWQSILTAPETYIANPGHQVRPTSETLQNSVAEQVGV